MIVFISTSYGMFEYTKQYSFCRGCHEMNQAHDTWMASKHGPILGNIDSCTACHAQEGFLGYVKTKLAGFKSVYYHITGQITGKYLKVAKGTKPVYCLKSGCHSMKDLDKYLKINVEHELHAKRDIKCVSCHDRIAHGWDDEHRSSPSMQDICFYCHANKTASHDNCGVCHIYQDNMLKGIGGFGLESIQSPHIAELSCKDCHTNSCAPDLQTCSTCHDNDLIERLNRLQADVSYKLEEIKASINQLERIFKQNDNNLSEFKEIYQTYILARKNYEYINKDLSRGIHNFDYTWNLLMYSEKKMNNIISSLNYLEKGIDY